MKTEQDQNNVKHLLSGIYVEYVTSTIAVWKINFIICTVSKNNYYCQFVTYMYIGDKIFQMTLYVVQSCKKIF